MKKIKQWVNQLSVKKKLVFYGYLTFAPVIFIVCLVLLFYSYNKGSEENLESNLASVNTLADSIHVLQSDIKDISTYLCINDDVRALLRAGDVEEKNVNAKLWTEEAPLKIVQDMVSLKGHIQTLAIYPENGIRPYLRGMDGSVYLPSVEEIRETEHYRETISSPGGMIWKCVPKGSGDTYLTNRTDKVVLYREIYDAARKKTLGYIVIGVQQERFRNLCEYAVQNEEESVLVLDKCGTDLLQVGNLDPKVEQYLKSEAFVEQDYRVRETHFTWGDYDIVCSQPDRNASIVCKIVPKYSFLVRVKEVAYMPIVLLVSILIGLMPLLLIISNIYTKPLSRLSDAIRLFSKGDFEQQVDVATSDEVGEAAECFNRMVGDIKDLIEQNYIITIKEKESEMAALQAQINPHFLYNTLDSLYWQALEEGNEQIAESILALSQLFRLVLNQGQKEVTAGQEIELVSRYLQIQKMRFTKKLEYRFEVEEEVKRVMIPKLILQPFVENAIVHGFENMTAPCYLWVRAKRDGGYIRFEIQDTGIGMRQDQIDAIWREEPERYRKQRIGRYAIKNIKERLELRYREDFRLEIQSDVGKGTMVTLMIPFKEEELDCR